MEILVMLLIAALFVWASPRTYADAMSRAAQKDIDYVRNHPDCSWYEAHRHRERVRRFFLRP